MKWDESRRTPARVEATVAQRIVAVAASSRAGAEAATAWRAWGQDAPTRGPDGALQWPDHADTAPSSRVLLDAASRVSHRHGTPLATVLDAVARIEREVSRAAAAREAALAGPLASARLLGWLPVVGVALASVIEPGTLRVLFATTLGWILVILAAALAIVGRRWMARQVGVAVGKARLE